MYWAKYNGNSLNDSNINDNSNKNMISFHLSTCSVEWKKTLSHQFGLVGCFQCDSPNIIVCPYI